MKCGGTSLSYVSCNLLSSLHELAYLQSSSVSQDSWDMSSVI